MEGQQNMTKTLFLTTSANGTQSLIQFDLEKINFFDRFVPEACRAFLNLILTLFPVCQASVLITRWPGELERASLFCSFSRSARKEEGCIKEIHWRELMGL